MQSSFAALEAAKNATPPGGPPMAAGGVQSRRPPSAGVVIGVNTALLGDAAESEVRSLHDCCNFVCK